MEELIYFNADFEKQLFSNQLKQPESNKLNQELEYLLFFIEPYKTVFTTKNYPENYLEFVSSISGTKPLITKKGDFATPWFGDYNQIDLKRIWQNKLEFYQFLEKYHFHLEGSQIISQEDQLKSDFLYKRGDQMSGRGHFLFPKDQKGILNYLKNGGQLLKEPLVKRSLDYSFLFENGALISEYINDIDNSFQYKGTHLGAKASIDQKLREKINRFLDLINEKLSPYTGNYSLDSYFYERSAGELDWVPCELNLRKTMGYIALKLKNLYFSDYPYFHLKISTNKCEKLYKKKGKDFICLSPLGNKFFIIAMAGKTEVEISKRQRELFS